MIGVMGCAALDGFGASKIRVEVDISRGIPAFQLVGLAENSVKEARVRVQSAITNAGFDFPRAKISVNLAPADVQKNGTGFDLAIALAILKAAGVIPEHKLKGVAAIGELSLTGEIRPVRGMLAMADSIKEQGFAILLAPLENAREASLISGLSVRVVSNFGEMTRAILSDTIEDLPRPEAKEPCDETDSSPDMSDVVGQEEARRALLIAAAGDHNLILMGGPGSGKSMMAHRMPSIFPPLSYEESITLTKIYSIAGLTMSGNLIEKRPFRAPHHSITKAGLVGGGSRLIRPGEISLSSFGVLFLDELLEFPRTVLEVLRQPLEDGMITLSRASQTVTYPAQISLVGALNPCPCGHFGQGKSKCICSPQSIARYQSRLSGPLIDRIDLYVNVPPVNLQLMSQEQGGESSASMRNRVIGARNIQKERFGKELRNGKMTRHDIKRHALMTAKAGSFLISCSEKLSFSARSFDRVIRVARTIADLDQSTNIHEHHIGEAIHYRPSHGFMKH
jgi:magnesium chelatase family protein